MRDPQTGRPGWLEQTRKAAARYNHASQPRRAEKHLGNMSDLEADALLQPETASSSQGQTSLNPPHWTVEDWKNVTWTLTQLSSGLFLNSGALCWSAGSPGHGA